MTIDRPAGMRGMLDSARVAEAHKLKSLLLLETETYGCNLKPFAIQLFKYLKPDVFQVMGQTSYTCYI